MELFYVASALQNEDAYVLLQWQRDRMIYVQLQKEIWYDIWSYKMNPYKLKKTYMLRIICKSAVEFSLNNIDTR